MDVMKTFSKILGMVPYISTLATNVILLRFGTYRLIHFNDATGSAINGITLATTDRPSADEKAIGLKRNSSLGTPQLGMVVVRYATGKINPYYSATYGANLSVLGATDVITASLFYKVG